MNHPVAFVDGDSSCGGERRRILDHTDMAAVNLHLGPATLARHFLRHRSRHPPLTSSPLCPCWAGRVVAVRDRLNARFHLRAVPYESLTSVRRCCRWRMCRAIHPLLIRLTRNALVQPNHNHSPMQRGKLRPPWRTCPVAGWWCDCMPVDVPDSGGSGGPSGALHVGVLFRSHEPHGPCGRRQ